MTLTCIQINLTTVYDFTQMLLVLINLAVWDNRSSIDKIEDL